jgi:hypothetical protein
VGDTGWTLEWADGILRIRLVGGWPDLRARHALVAETIAAGVTTDVPLLIDVRGAGDSGAPSYPNLILATSRGGTEDHQVPTRRAFLVGSPLQYGVCRQLQALIVRDGREAEIFWTEQEAVDWLESSKSGAHDVEEAG